MKIFSILLTIIAIGLISFNVGTKIDINAPFQGESVVALITIFSFTLCSIISTHIKNIKTY